MALSRSQRRRLQWRLRVARLQCAWSGLHDWSNGYDPETGRCWHVCRACFTGSGVLTTAEQRYDAAYLHGLGVKP